VNSLTNANKRLSGPKPSPRPIAIYIPTLAGGGAELSMLRLAGELANRGHAVDLLLNRHRGAYAERVPANVNVAELARYSKWRARLAVWRARPRDIDVVLRPVMTARVPIMSLRYLGGLADYLRSRRPGVLVSAMFYSNLVALWARDLAGVDVPVVVTEHNTLSQRIAQGRSRGGETARWRGLPALIGRVYSRADAIVTVSDGVAGDLAEISGLARQSIATIYNPVVFPQLEARAREPLKHDWFGADNSPVLIAVGRLEAQKDFGTLLEAFARVRAGRTVRLIVLGEGSQRKMLETRVQALGVAADVLFPGWVDNPYAWMSRAALFVLSSEWEGLGNVLIEAMACGCPVVSTDCPHGPREILDNGRLGRLVPVSDADALAAAIIATLDAPLPGDALRKRASEFSLARCADQYEALIAGILTA